MIQRPKGTADWFGQEMAYMTAIEEVVREVSESYRFQEVRTPIFESYDLFSRGVGNGTDIVTKEMYDFKDKGDRHIALRPEGTASVVRAYIENKWFGPEYPHPFKATYIGPMFRYERPQAGRMRQFHQFGAEVFAEKDPRIDAEVIAMACEIFNTLGLGQLKIAINSLGLPEERAAYRNALVAYLEPLEEQLSADSKRRYKDNPLRVLDSKDKGDQELTQDAPKLSEYLSKDSKHYFEEVLRHLDLLKIAYVVDERLVRGLDYYQDTVFEIMTESEKFGANTTICAGGRYDGLVSSLGGPETAGVGFACGMERLALLMQLEEANDSLRENELDVYVVTIGEDASDYGFKLVNDLRSMGYVVDQDYRGRAVKKQFKQAQKDQAKLVVTIGENEIAESTISIKALKTGKEASLPIEDVEEDFDGIFNRLTIDSSVIDAYFNESKD